MKRLTTTPLNSPALPWLLVVALSVLLAGGPSRTERLNPFSAAWADNRLDEIKGKHGQGGRADDVPAGTTGWAFGVGAGADTDNLRPATYSKKLQVNANFSAGFGYSLSLIHI